MTYWTYIPAQLKRLEDTSFLLSEGVTHISHFLFLSNLICPHCKTREAVACTFSDRHDNFNCLLDLVDIESDSLLQFIVASKSRLHIVL